MKVRTIVICAVVTAMLGGVSAVALAPSAAVEPAVLECESWEVPGWLNEAGEATGCVDNAPCPEAREGLPCPADVPVVVAPETPEQVQTLTINPPAEVPAEPVAPEENGACN